MKGTGYYRDNIIEASLLRYVKENVAQTFTMPNQSSYSIMANCLKFTILFQLTVITSGQRGRKRYFFSNFALP